MGRVHTEVILFGLFFLGLAGCSSSGTDGSESAQEDIQADVATDAQVVEDIQSQEDVVEDTGSIEETDIGSTPDVVSDIAGVEDVLADEESDPCPGLIECNGLCVDPETDPGHCGECNHVCPSGGKCKDFECYCPATTTPGICGNQCKDLDDDIENCGECDHVCPEGATCETGACACPGGLSVCGDSCVDLESDPVHCGNCGVSCPIGTACVGGYCELPPPRQLAPLSTMHVSTQQPTFQWELTEIQDGAVLELCEDPDCLVLIDSIEVAGAEWMVEEDLSSGPIFWRLRGMAGGAVGAQTSPVWVVHIPSSSSELAFAWGSVPDFNRDGFGEAVVGACGLGAQGCSQEAYIFDGSPTGLDALSPKVVGAGGAVSVFGYATGSAGDVNGDGYGDLVVGSWVTSTIYIYLGGPEGLGDTPIVEIHESGGIFPLFGHAVGSAGDVNGDGYADVVSGNPLDSAIYVYYGGPEGPTQGNSDTLFASTENGIGMGISAQGACDLNGDGYSDVMGGNGTGEVLVYYGGPLGPDPENSTLLSRDDVEGGSLCTFDADCAFGISVSCIGDANGDGYADLAVGAAAYDGAFVYLGGPTGVESSPSFTLQGGDSLGISIAAAGDINGDGRDDVIVGGKEFAAIYSIPDTPGLVEAMIQVDGATGSFGNAVAGARDVNGDGVGEVFVGDPALGFVRVFSFGLDGLPFFFQELRAQGTAGCASAECEALICPSDGYCCDVAWDPQCAEFANDACDVCPMSNCCAKKSTKGCSDSTCSAAVCALSGYESCCISEWEKICALKAEELCEICPPDNCCTPNEATGFGFSVSDARGEEKESIRSRLRPCPG